MLNGFKFSVAKYFEISAKSETEMSETSIIKFRNLLKNENLLQSWMFANFLDCFGPLIFEFSNLLCILVGGIVDRTFQVGSPPSSSGGSIGSESERIHRQDIPKFLQKRD